MSLLYFTGLLPFTYLFQKVIGLVEICSLPPISSPSGSPGFTLSWLASSVFLLVVEKTSHRMAEMPEVVWITITLLSGYSGAQS